MRLFLACCVLASVACGPQSEPADDVGGSTGDDADDGGPASTSADSAMDDAAGTTAGDDAGSDDAGDDDDGAASDDTTSAADDASTDADTGDASEDGSTTGPLDPLCQALTDVVLLDPFVEPLEGAWTPGSMLRVGATLHNTGAEDFLDYPGILVSADMGTVEPSAENWLFAIFADMQSPLDVVFTADPRAEPGTEVTFTLEIASLNNDCPGQDSAQISATIAAP